MLVVAFAVACSASTRFELHNYNPVASTGAVVVSGNARFSFLTPRLVRIEWSRGAFEDRASLAFLNRQLPVPPLTTNVSNSVLTVSTSALTLTYQQGAAFSAASLQVAVHSTGATYHFGDADTGNLLGTIRSLDELNVQSLNCTLNANVSVHEESLHCEWGLISRGGWAVVDDSKNQMLGTATSWWESPNADDVDLYLFGHGTDYLGALADFTLVSGPIAMTPRASLGVMWSRWFNLNDQDVVDLVEAYESRALPLDAFILDMDWHTKQGWGAFSFDRNLFPNPSVTMSYLQSRGLLTSGNLHDANGVAPYEDQYAAFCAAIGVDPALNRTIAFDIANETYALALEDSILKPLEDQGFGSFWWIDWQQGGKQGGCSGDKMNPTIILNRLRATDPIRRGSQKRGMVLSRFGGLGNHRYQVGFSGDVDQLSWANLAYQPYFSFTASNVLFGFWSHDLVGPYGDDELYTRWIQWGAFSSVFRTHDRGMASGSCAQQVPPSCSTIKMWDVPTPFFDANRDAVQERHRLLPYLYNAMAEAYTTGVSLMRPLYYYWPLESASYLGDQAGNFAQYMLGPDIMVAPVVSAGYINDTLARSTFWIPPGLWIDELTGALVQGNSTVTRWYDLSEVPRFVKAGAIIPKLALMLGNTIGRAQQQYSALELHVYLPPGESAGNVAIYEDDASTTAYVGGAFALTHVAYSATVSSGVKSVKLSVAPISGTYSGMVTQRPYTLRMVAWAPSSVVINGVTASYNAQGGPGTWRYDGSTLQVVVETGAVPTSQALNVIVQSASYNENLLYGLKGLIRRAVLSKRTLDPSWSTPGAQIVQPANLAHVAALGRMLSSWAATPSSGDFYGAVLGLRNMFIAAQNEIAALKPAHMRRTTDSGVTAPSMAQWMRAYALLQM